MVCLELDIRVLLVLTWVLVNQSPSLPTPKACPARFGRSAWVEREAEAQVLLMAQVWVPDSPVRSSHSDEVAKYQSGDPVYLQATR
jgi:hypothetical protein